MLKRKRNKTRKKVERIFTLGLELIHTYLVSKGVRRCVSIFVVVFVFVSLGFLLFSGDVSEWLTLELMLRSVG